MITVLQIKEGVIEKVYVYASKQEFKKEFNTELFVGEDGEIHSRIFKDPADLATNYATPEEETSSFLILKGDKFITLDMLPTKRWKIDKVKDEGQTKET